MFLVIQVKWKILGRSGKQKRGKSHSVGHIYCCWSADSDLQVEIALDLQLLKLLLDSSTVSQTPGPGVCACACVCVCILMRKNPGFYSILIYQAGWMVYLACKRALCRKVFPSGAHLMTGHHRRSWTTVEKINIYAIQLPLPSYLFYTWQHIYINITLSISSPFSFPCCVHKSVLYVCVSLFPCK